MSTISAQDVNRVNAIQASQDNARTGTARNATPDSVRMSPFVRGISHPPDHARQGSEDPSQSKAPQISNLFFFLDSAFFTQYRDPAVRPSPQGAFRLRGKEAIFIDGPGLEPRT